MIKSYLKIAWRNLSRQKSYSLISIGGLSLGLACCMAVFLFVQDETSYDRYHENSDRIYRLVNLAQDDAYEGIAKVNGPWGLTAVRELPEVVAATRFLITGQTLFTQGEKRFYEEDGFFADSTVFDVFSFKLLTGNAPKALVRPNSIVLTQGLANKYFGTSNPIGQTLTLDNRTTVEVTAVIQDVPENSHFTFSYLLSMEGYDHPRKDDWIQWNQYYTYLLLEPEAEPSVVASKFARLLPKYMDAEVAANYQPMLQKLTDIHLHSHLFREINANSDVSYIYIFSGIGALILVISCINFVNLSTARAMLRAKEVGIRKSSGAVKRQLVFQYLSESLLLTLVSLFFAVILLSLVLPAFNSAMGKNLTIHFTNLGFIGAALLISMLVGALSGSYPAFFLANLKPTEVLKGMSYGTGRNTLRHSLVVMQFAISAFLIISVSIIYNQLSFIQEKQLGFNPNELITVPIQDQSLRQRTELIKNELRKLPGVVDISVSGNQPGGSDWGIPYVPEGLDAENTPAMRILAVDHDFINTFQMELAEGRNFSREFSSDSLAYVINEEAARQLGWAHPLDHRIGMPAIDRPQGPIIGVLKDFHFRSLKEKIGPVMLFMPPASWNGMFTIRVSTKRMEESVRAIERKFAEFDPGHPFSYSFFDETYGRLYNKEKQFGKLVGYFTAIGILIACLGLYSLAAFTTEQRTKEVGVRKVLGASVSSITMLMSRDLMKLVIIGFAIAAPAGYLAMKEWLGSFAYQVAISPLTFLAAGASLMVIAWVTVSFKVLDAGLANPVASLKNE